METTDRGRIAVAIDGPAGAGKSTAAKAVAGALGIGYLDTGAMYRALALYAIRHGVDPTDEAGMERILPGADITVKFTAGGQRTLLLGEDVTELLRTQTLGMGASNVSKHPAVRDRLSALQRRIAEETDVVMDGRDITTNVLPHTKYKFYITASAHERALRRFRELSERGGCDKTVEEIEREIVLRDENDMNRPYMPLRQAEDAVCIDTTDLSIDEVTALILRRIREKE